MSNKKKFVAVGTGARISMFIDPIVDAYAADCELLALCDISQVRMNYHRDRLARDYGYKGEIRTYLAEEFDRMLDEMKPDAVIVCTIDSLHHDYIIRSLEKGCEVFCEKPITVDDEKCRAILEAVRRTGGKVRVTFNVRWTPGVTKVYELLASGVIGNVKHVHMEYSMDTVHGADYFRRWHSQKANSGGLLVHKSTHHFDLINWWVNSIPANVYASGGLVFYGRKNALARGDEALTRYTRYCETNQGLDPYFFDLNETEEIRELYLEAEAETGYIRDRNVFRDGIDIEDTMSVLINYRNGVTLNYSLNAFCPEEGYRVTLTGDKGRIEYSELYRSYDINGQLNEVHAAGQEGEQRFLRVLPLHKAPYTLDIPRLAGSHGGGDTLLQEQIFSESAPADPFARSAGHEQGIASALVGIAANRAIETGNSVKISDLACLRPEALKLTELI